MSHYYVKAADLEDVDICVLIPEYFIHMALKRRKIYLWCYKCRVLFPPLLDYMDERM